MNSNNRIARNTIMLYVRMFFLLIIGLITSRVVLKVLGVEDYGIYNVVGGVVTMMTFVSNSLAIATQRFLTFEIGKCDEEGFVNVFSTSLNIYFVFSIILIIFGETIGLWFVNTYLTISGDRLVAANWVYQASLFSCAISLFNVPYKAALVAYEKMDAFAIIAIIDAVLRIAIVYILIMLSLDRLQLYGLLMFTVSVIIFFGYYGYCKIKLSNCNYHFCFNKVLTKELLAYSGWNLFGALAMTAKGQGLNIMLNMFFNPVVNAARAVAYQVNGLVNQFFGSFYTAVEPQIIKSYARNDCDYLVKLIVTSSKLSYYLILLISLPIIFQSEYIINLWLGQCIDYVVPFVNIIIVISAIDAISSPIMTAIQATGEIKKYQIVIGSIVLMNLPFSWIALNIGCGPLSVFYVSCFISIVSFFVRLHFLKIQLNFNILIFIKEVLYKIIPVTIIALICPLLYLTYITIDSEIVDFSCCVVICLLNSSLAIWFFGLNKTEKNYFMSYVNKKLKKNKL